MGVSLHVLERMRWLEQRQFLPRNGAMLELGSQDLYRCSNRKALCDFIRQFGGDPRQADLASLGEDKMARLMTLCGWSYAAIDIFRADGVTLLDLNLHELPTDFIGRFDLVTNFGTSEHVINQMAVFRAVHEAAKVGGIIYHDVPMGGYFYHGYFNYTPLLFHHVAIANDYEILFNAYGIDRTVRPSPAEMIVNGYPELTYHDAAVEFAFRKKRDAPFRLPLEIGTSAGLDESLWGGNVPYAVIRGSQSVRQPHLKSFFRRPLRWLLKLMVDN